MEEKKFSVAMEEQESLGGEGVWKEWEAVQKEQEMKKALRDVRRNKQ